MITDNSSPISPKSEKPRRKEERKKKKERFSACARASARMKMSEKVKKVGCLRLGPKTKNDMKATGQETPSGPKNTSRRCMYICQ